MKQAHNANKRRTEEPRLNIRQLVLLSSKNINVPNKAPKLKPRCLGSFPVSSTDYQCKNCGLDLTSKPELSLIYNTFHISNLKPDLQNNDNKFPLSGLSKPRPVEDDRYEVEKVLEYCTAPGTGQPQYKVRWLGYSYNDDQWINADHVNTEILQDFWTKGSPADTFKQRRKGHKGFKTRHETRALMQNEQERVINLPVTSATINIESPSFAKQIFDLLLK